MIRRRLRPAAPFAFFSLAVAVVMGAVLATALTSGVRAGANQAAERLVDTVAVSTVEPNLESDDLDGPTLDPRRRAELSLALAPAVSGGPLRHLTVIAAGGRTVWADRLDLIGRSRSDDPRIERALAGRRTTETLHRTGDDDVIRAVLPMRAAVDHDAGAVEMEISVPGVVSSQRRDVMVVMGLVALAMLLMWLLLVRLADRTTRALRRTMEDNERRSRTDAPTGLPNRTAFAAELERVVREHGRAAVASLDIDHFKQVNDSFGHRSGDDVLALVAQRLRECAPPGMVVARLGGDEFACVATGPYALGEVRHVLRNLSGLALLLGGARIEIAVSAGLAVWDGASVDPEVLLQRADVALYAAKRRGVPAVEWDSSMAARTAQRLEMLSDLRTAVADEELELFLQPAASPRTGQVTGGEVLLRWNHPEHGLLGPDEFVPLAEQNDLIHDLTRWMIDAAVEQCARWRAAGLDLEISVNISPRDLTDDLPVAIDAALQTAGLPPGQLCIELTETCLPTSMDAARSTLAAIARLGVRIAVDDFGTGFATLSWLTELCFNELKVDRRFVDRMDSDGASAELVRHVVALGHGLGMKVVAEGVETPAQWDLLGKLEADVAQGFLIARPMPIGDFPEWLAGWYGGRTATDPVVRERTPSRR